MREDFDCHNAVIATACQVTYEEASKATGHKDLLGQLESPIFSNPWNLYRALIKLGFWKINITWPMLRDGIAVPGKTIVLVKQDLLTQHWCVWDGLLHVADGETYHRVFWGDSTEPRFFTEAKFKDMFEKDLLFGKKLWVCAFQVYKANFWDLLLAKTQSLIERVKEIFRPS